MFHLRDILSYPGIWGQCRGQIRLSLDHRLLEMREGREERNVCDEEHEKGRCEDRKEECEWEKS